VPGASAAARREQSGGLTANPTFRLVSLDGERLELSALRGKAVVLNFWFTSCIPSCAQLPALNRLVEAHRGSDEVEFIGIALDDEDALRRFLADNRFRYTVASDPEGDVARLYGVSAYPTHIVIDRRGHVLGRLSGGMERMNADSIPRHDR
jgi:peroxiredoxin